VPGLPIGLLGVGLLGAALAERMAKAGLPVLGFDLDRARREPLERAGGRFAAAMHDLSQNCRTLVLCLPDSAVVASALEELGAALQPGMLVIDATTGDPDATAALAAQLKARAIDYVDATIAGSSEQTRRGEAVVLIGGEPAALERAEHVLHTWSERRFHIGPPGSGARMKLVVNLVLGLNRAVLAEGLSLALACGFDPGQTLEILKSSAAYSAAMDTKGPKMVARDFTPVARLAQHLKDVRLIEEMAQKCGALTPLSRVHEQLLERGVELGLGDADNSAIIEVFRHTT
jgi:3-hydroxyisobutyrate dehydrogenase-like beta-hydroxyacid dehydrogenase